MQYVFLIRSSAGSKKYVTRRSRVTYFLPPARNYMSGSRSVDTLLITDICGWLSGGFVILCKQQIGYNVSCNSMSCNNFELDGLWYKLYSIISLNWFALFTYFTRVYSRSGDRTFGRKTFGRQVVWENNVSATLYLLVLIFFSTEQVRHDVNSENSVT